MKNIYIIITLSIIFSVKISAQNSIRPNIYFQDMNFYNASSVPIDSSQNYYFSLLGNYKFVKNESEIWDKLPTFYLNHIGRIKDYNLYYSVAYLNDNYSFFNRNGLYLGVTYQLKWGRFSSISFGGKAVLNFDIVNFDKLYLSEKKEKTLLFCPDLDLGIEYKVKGFTLGLASQNLVGFSSKKENEGLIKNKRIASLNVSYLFNIGDNYKIAPLGMLYWDRKINYDIGIYASFYEYARISYVLRINELRNIFTADVRIISNLYLGAAFDFSLLLPDKNLGIVLKYGF